MFPQAQVHGVSGRGWPHSPQNLPVLEVPQPGQVHALPGCVPGIWPAIPALPGCIPAIWLGTAHWLPAGWTPDGWFPIG